QFLQVDPALNLTAQVYNFAGGDPVNGSDPLGLWGWNPISNLVQAATDVGHFVAKHKVAFEVGGGIALGVLAAATGVGAIIEGASVVGVLLSIASVATGAGAAYLDAGPCASGNQLACMGLGLGATSAVAGLFSLAGAALVTFGIIGEESLMAAILGGAGAFAWNVGLGATVLDSIDAYVCGA
ncbi:MAG: RHS repeat-associated core domain-containing protein, partial [Acidimicrobiales bacterium]